MNFAAELLVIIQSIFLAIFLGLAIVLSVYLISLTRQLRRITQSAERTVDNVGKVVSDVSKITTPMFIADMVSKFVNKIKKDKKE